MSAPPMPKFRVDENNTIGVLLVSPNSRLRVAVAGKASSTPLEFD